jgi:dipeptidyl aminopeptidase/acylaminoacyl peptidase
MNGRSRKLILAATAAAAVVVLAVVAWHCSPGGDLPADCLAAQRLPRIRPDYSATVIPPNIAPLNFVVEEPGVEYRVRIHGAAGQDILIASAGPIVIIPPRPWRELLGQNRGGRIVLDVYVKGEDGRWSRFDSIENGVAREKIDSHLVYRLLGPVCGFYRNMGIYQRNLENYDESPILTNDKSGGCLNCHSFPKNRPDTFSFQVRPGRDRKTEAGMIVVRDGHAFRLKTQSKAAPKPPSYTSWHPSGSLAAFSMIQPTLCIHGAGAEIRDEFDFQSDLAAVNVKTGAISTSPAIADPARMDTFPGWSADGKTLYFVSARPLWNQHRPLLLEDIKKVMYDLMRVRYDIEKDTWGQPETLLSAADTGLSITEPRASPDGRYLLFCMSDHGCFPVYQSSSDLYLMELASGKHRRLQCNSRQSESWHCWSSNSRWIVFSSKRDNSLLARPYFSYLDAEGREHKPFVLPQKAPTFYDTWLRTYNVPELVTGAVTVPQAELVRAVRSGDAATDEPPKAGTPLRANEGSYQHD